MVSVSGPGISFAYCHENADFVIDGREAGPGHYAKYCLKYISDNGLNIGIRKIV